MLNSMYGRGGGGLLPWVGFTKDIACLTLESSGERYDHFVDTVGKEGAGSDDVWGDEKSTRWKFSLSIPGEMRWPSRGS